MQTLNTKARLAGFWYLVMGITGALGLMVIPSQLIVPGDAAATASNILQSPGTFRWGILVNLICQVSFVFAVLALKELFKGVDRKQSQLMVGLVYVSVPIAFLNTLNLVAAQLLLGDSNLIAAFDSQQLQSLSLFFINLYKQGTFLVETFWGLWLLPFGILTYKSGFLPKILGILLIVACFGYLAESVSSVIAPKQREIVSVFTSISGSVGELSFIFWVLIVGARNKLSFSR